MRNVSKGFQISKLAIPKMHMAAINKEFNSYHSGGSGRLYTHAPPRETLPKMPKRPGINKGFLKV